MKNFKNVVILCLFFVLSIQNSLANVDQTNAFEFEYDCTESGGVLKTDFSLGSHHHYLRHYNINKPGIIEIRDDIHTTVAKSTNISIRGCNFIPETCDITNEGTWEYVEGEDTTFKSLNISTVLDQDFITKSGDVITLEGTGSTDTIDIDFDSPYSGTGRTLALSLLEEKIELVEYFNNEDGTLESNVLREFIFENKQYAGINEFYYDVSDDNKSIIIKKKKFKKVSRGITSSSENSFDIYSASSGQNTGSDTCENPNGESNSSYCTGLDYWDHNQHHYTTTKVKLHAVPLDCTSVTFSGNSGGTTLSSTPYNATLEGLVQPIFSGPILLNGEEADGWNSITLFATDEDVVVKNLLYERVGEIAGNSIAITKIGTSLKKDDITLGSDLFELTTAKSSRGIFDDFRINLKDDLDNILFKKEGEYQLMFTFIGSNDQQVGTYGIPLTIIPNNELKTDGPVTISNSSLFADGVSKTSICQRISDEFGNRIDKDYSVSNTQVAILSEINTDQKNSTGNALSVDNFTFTNSKACFDISSIAPGKKVLKFQLQLPTHILSNTLDLDGGVKNIDIQTESIDFKKIYTGSLKIDELFGITPQTLRVGELYTLSTIATKDNSVTETTTSPVLTITDEISLLDGYIAENQNQTGNKRTFDFNYGGTDVLPEISFNFYQSPWISYEIQGRNVKYRLSASNLGDDLSELTLSVESKFMGVEIIGTYQGQGKQEITGQDSNVSDISKMGLRAEIRKNAYQYVQSMTSDQAPLNGIKYVDAANLTNNEYPISGTLGYETLVVKNGNVKITGDISSANTLGIIVLQDNFNVSDNIGGNIIVESGVKKINAVIYADGGLIPDGSSTNQLSLNGALFTRNTIGGSIGAEQTFVLPGGDETNDHDLAKKYDLNHIRSSNNDWASTSGFENATFVIKYNSSIQANPPKLFGN